MIEVAARLVASPRFRLMLLMLLMSMILLACDEPWDKFPAHNH